LSPSPPEHVIADSFSPAERERFHNLLKLAAESPFIGERDNALAAARRMAARFGMSLEEAAADASRRQEPAAQARQEAPAERDPLTGRFGYFFHLSEAQLQADKARREASLQAAYARGLDEEQRNAEPPRRAPIFRRASSDRRMDPLRHARNLLLETTLPLGEIVRLTGLSIWQVTGLKLQLRPEFGRPRTGQRRF